MKFTDPTYQRIRSSFCDENGLNETQLDEHAAYITSIVKVSRAKLRSLPLPTHNRRKEVSSDTNRNHQ